MIALSDGKKVAFLKRNSQFKKVTIRNLINLQFAWNLNSYCVRFLTLNKIVAEDFIVSF